MCNENVRKVATEEFIENLLLEIRKSPLYKIKGECRFPTHIPEEIEGEKDSFFDDSDVRILFSCNNQKIGDIIISQENVESCDMDENKESNITLSFNAINVGNVGIYIKYSGKWPYLFEFGEFIAFFQKI